jgi:hypothetical protein
VNNGIPLIVICTDQKGHRADGTDLKVQRYYVNDQKAWQQLAPINTIAWSAKVKVEVDGIHVKAIQIINSFKFIFVTFQVDII